MLGARFAACAFELRAAREITEAETMTGRRCRQTTFEQRIATLRTSARDQCQPGPRGRSGACVWQGKCECGARAMCARESRCSSRSGLLKGFCGNPAIRAASAAANRTGGFASPSYDGFALVRRRAVCAVRRDQHIGQARIDQRWMQVNDAQGEE